MVDTFKDYGDEVLYKAIVSDSGMMIMAALIGSHLASRNLNTNIIVLTMTMYLLPYLLYN